MGNILHKEISNNNEKDVQKSFAKDISKVEIVNEKELLYDPDKEYECTPLTKAKKFTELMHAVMRNDVNKVEEILKNDPVTIDYKNSSGFTALMLACRNAKTKSSEKIVELLLTAGADVNIVNNYKNTALMYACKNSRKESSEETVKLLIAAGANLDLQDINGFTALMYASRHSGDLSTEETVKMLVDAGANLDLQNNDGNSALILASKYALVLSSENTVKILVNAGANMNLQNNGGFTALMEICCNKLEFVSTNAINILINGPMNNPENSLKQKCNVDLQNTDGITALMIIIDNPKNLDEVSKKEPDNKTETVIKLLIKAGANLNLKDKMGRSALANAYEFTKYCNIDQQIIASRIVKILISAGADFNVLYNINGWCFRYIIKHVEKMKQAELEKRLDDEKKIYEQKLKEEKEKWYHEMYNPDGIGFRITQSHFNGLVEKQVHDN